MKKLFYYLLIATSISTINISCKDDNVTPPAEEEGNSNNTDTDTDNGDNNNNTNDGTYIAVKPNWPDDDLKQKTLNSFGSICNTPYSKIEPVTTSDGRPYAKEYSYNIMKYAMAYLYTAYSSAEGANYASEANKLIAENMKYYMDNQNAITDTDNFQWHSEVLFRIIELFGSNGLLNKNLLSPENEKAIMDVAWIYCKRNPDNANSDIKTIMAKADKNNIWLIYGSEINHIQSITTLWHFAKLASLNVANYKDMVYDDGRKPIDHLKDWNNYIIEFIREYATRGLCIEQMNTYNNEIKFKCFFNLHDFGDEKLNKLSKNILDLYFPYWAEEQFNGISGGAKSGTDFNNSSEEGMYGNYFFGLGNNSETSSTKLSAMTTSYRPNEIIKNIALNSDNRGIYTITRRIMGLAKDANSAVSPFYGFSKDCGLLHYSYCTPNFIMSCNFFDSKNNLPWSDISTRNRSCGIQFNGDKTSCIIPQTYKYNESGEMEFNIYNDLVTFQKEGVMIVKKNTFAKVEDGHTIGKLGIWISDKGISDPEVNPGRDYTVPWIIADVTGETTYSNDTWVAVKSGEEGKETYTGIYVVNGDYKLTTKTINKNKGIWLECENNDAIIILLSLTNGHPAFPTSFDSFKRTLTKNISGSDVDFNENSLLLKYKTVYYDNTKKFYFYGKQDGDNRFDTTAPLLTPSKCYDSPFIEGYWGDKTIRIKSNGATATLDFN